MKAQRSREYSPIICMARKNKAQTILEYATVVVCVVLALLAMRVYIQRAMQGRYRVAADQLGQQYAPGNTIGNSVIDYDSNSETWVSNFSERQISERLGGAEIDLNGNGVANEDNVYATETISWLGIPVAGPDGDINDIMGGSLTHEVSNETVGPIQ